MSSQLIMAVFFLFLSLLFILKDTKAKHKVLLETQYWNNNFLKKASNPVKIQNSTVSNSK